MIPPERRTEFVKIPIEVVPAEDFHARTGKDPDAAHAAIVPSPDGPRVIVQPDAPARALHEEGLHMLQRTEAGQGEKIASFEKLSRDEFRALPVERRAEIVRNYLEVEIDAQQRLIQANEANLHSPDPAVRAEAEIALAHFHEKAALYRAQLERLGGFSPDQLRTLAETGHVLLNEVSRLQQKKSVQDHPRPENWDYYRQQKRAAVDRKRSSYDDHPLMKGRDDVELRQVGDSWIEEDMDGVQRRYRRVEVVDADKIVIGTREEIEHPHGSGDWRQRGSWSTKAGADLELASAELIKRHRKEAAEYVGKGGERREVIQIDAKHSGSGDPSGLGNAGFDNNKLEFTHHPDGTITCNIVQVEVKNYGGDVGFDAFSANTRNYRRNVEALAQVIGNFKFPSEAHRLAAEKALNARRFVLEVHIGPRTSLGAEKARKGSVLGKIERAQRTCERSRARRQVAERRRGSERAEGHGERDASRPASRCRLI